MMTMPTIFALPLFVVAAPSGTHALPAPDDSSRMTLVVVDNERTVPVTVFVQDENREYKLGVVDPGSEKTLRLPDAIVGRGEISFFVSPRGQLEEGTRPLDLHYGEHVGLVIPPRK